ncbi:Tyrosine-protein kinase SYK [Schistosoma japonicum]|nr:Tyrosine-protein kinase SYK [Schistosoma japonicum]KAH8873210.1 Tyrosine-protein kinase SYK [Schistosoma japonicum]KAH8873211.1 Tyrosine-protein kinase SYK [Schistosoma japonicum]KAH8873212.1 Tyrosine-protein kinase SYK [Schistosoma japonicum]
MNVTNNVVVTPAHLLTLLPGAIPPESTTYFYGKITREQAEELLFTHGASEGLFLLRESVNRNYAVSICHLGRVHHYNVERQTDCSYRIQTGHKFIGPVELVQHHSTQLDGFLTLAQLPLNRPAGISPIVLQGLNADDLDKNLRLKAIEMGLKGQSVEEALNGPMRNHLRFLVIKDLHLLQPWYHHTIRRYEAELRLANEGNKEGAFLVRYRKDDRTYVLSLSCQNEPKHYRIEEYLSRWSIEGGQYFETIMELIDHYHFRQDGLLCKLQKPIPVSNFTRALTGSFGVSKIATDDFKVLINPDKNQQFKSPTMTSNVWNSSHSLPSLNSIPVTGINSFHNTNISNQSIINKGVNSTVMSTTITPTTTTVTTTTIIPTTITTTITTITTTIATIITPTTHTTNTVRQDLISFNDWPNVTKLLSNQNSPNEIASTSVVSGTTTTTTISEQACNVLNRYPIQHTPFTPPITSTLSMQTPLKSISRHSSSNRLTQVGAPLEITTTTLRTTIPDPPAITSNPSNFPNAMLIGSTLIPQMALLDREINDVTKLMNGQTTSNNNIKDLRIGCLKPIRINEPLTSVSKAFAEVDNAIAQVVSDAFSTTTPSNNSQSMPPITGMMTSVTTTTSTTTATTVKTSMIAPSIDNLMNNCSNAHFIHNHFNQTTNTTEHHNDNLNIISRRLISNKEFLPAQTLHFPPILDTPWEEPDCSEDHAQSTSSSGGSFGGCGGSSGGSCGGGGGGGSSGLTPTNTNLSTFIGNNPFLPLISPTLTRRTSSLGNSSQLNKANCTDNNEILCSATSCHHHSTTNNSTTTITNGPMETQSNRSAWANAISPENAQLIYDELPPSNFLLNSQTVTLKERLGGGNFGHVVKGLYRTPSGQEVPVAVKTLKPNQIVNSGEREILAEARTMAQLKHRHIVRLIGVCKEEQFMLVLELAPLGPINKYLKKRPDVSVHTLTELMHQVALGMAYLESCKFVHRDLAARNVLLVTRHFAKISDFGMSKALNFGSDYYRAATAGKWPLKWYAPECIYYFRFDSKSDVWSYGITLWEVYSYGERPYRDMKGAQILAMLDQGLRLSRPSRCPESIYSVMQQCWNFEGVHRPTFAELVLIISRILRAMPSPQTNICISNHHHHHHHQHHQNNPNISNNDTTNNISNINSNQNHNQSNNVISSNLSMKFDHLHSPTHQRNTNTNQNSMHNNNNHNHTNNTGLHPIEFSPTKRLGGIGTSTSSGGSGVNSGGSDGISF